jgi:hypothetical protein
MAGSDIVSVPVAGGDPVVIGTALGGSLNAIALDATHVFYATTSEVGSIPLPVGSLPV